MCFPKTCFHRKSQTREGGGVAMRIVESQIRCLLQPQLRCRIRSGDCRSSLLLTLGLAFSLLMVLSAFNIIMQLVLSNSQSVSIVHPCSQSVHPLVHSRVSLSSFLETFTRNLARKPLEPKRGTDSFEKRFESPPRNKLVAQLARVDNQVWGNISFRGNNQTWEFAPWNVFTPWHMWKVFGWRIDNIAIEKGQNIFRRILNFSSSKYYLLSVINSTYDQSHIHHFPSSISSMSYNSCLVFSLSLFFSIQMWKTRQLDVWTIVRSAE